MEKLGGFGRCRRLRCARVPQKFAALCLVAGCGIAYPQSHDLVTNLQYRLRSGDLGEVVAGPITSLRGVRIERGGANLLQDCLDHPEKWWRDPLMYRFGHRQPFTTIGCREYRTPSMHSVFYLQPDGSREAWIHFDLHDPRDLVGHSLEVTRNRLTLGHTSQTDVYRSYLKHDGNSQEALPPLTYDYAANRKEYLTKTFGTRYLMGAAALSAITSPLEHSTSVGPDHFANHFAERMLRHTVRESLEYGTAALLKQEQTFVPSGEDRIMPRVRSALYRAFFVPGHNGDELAFPRIAAATGTALMTQYCHPFNRQAPDPLLVGSAILAKYVADSFWREFRPDIKHALKSKAKFLKRD